MKATLKLLLVLTLLYAYTACNSDFSRNESAFQPNILWIYVEDMSPNWGCYGDSTVQTPNIDRLSQEGVRFTNVYGTAPICSIFRSALITGMYQTSIGAHNHRSQNAGGKAGGNERFYESYHLPDTIPFLPRLFQEAGYYTVNAGKIDGPGDAGKTDYNFEWERSAYNGDDWSGRKDGQPFFAQLQMSGGKARKVKVAAPVNPEQVQLPPYYPDDEILREDWAEYLNTVIHLDDQVGQILERLESEEILDSTIVFLFTDHGVSHLRGKQFLYDEGIHIPLIIRYPRAMKVGGVEARLISHIDIAATSLQLAGIDIPPDMQARSFVENDREPREMVYSTRDRADETIDMIRSVRTANFKYIRNFYPNKPHAQENQYKDGKQILQRLRQLYAQGQLEPKFARYFYDQRPVEELYDLTKDPWEMHNLASDPAYLDTLADMQKMLFDWMRTSGDLGMIPEPVAEELGKKHGNKYFIYQKEGKQLQSDCLTMMAADEKGEVETLLEGLTDERPFVRFWAAYGLGNLMIDKTIPELEPFLNDDNIAVKLAAARAMCLMGESEKALKVLEAGLKDDNVIASMYAAEFIEDVGPVIGKDIMPAIHEATKSPYEFTGRIAKRLVKTWSN